jgi:beta-lactamase superfamily II metal-dependent hydrolase
MMRLPRKSFSLVLALLLALTLPLQTLAGKPLVIKTPSSGESVSGTYLITGGGDGSPVEISFDYTTWNPVDGDKSWSYSWDTTTQPDGPLTIYARYTDGSDEVSVNVTVSNGGGSGGETCAVTAGAVLLNEVLPAPSSGSEWVELYNTTDGEIDLSYCYLDDIADGGGSPYQIPAGTTIAAGGFWTVDFGSFYNNSGDDVRLLKEDATTVLDSYTYGATDYDVSWYRSPDGGAWAADPTASPTKGATNGGATSGCGTGTWTSGNLEIHHINVGQGDATLVVGPTGRSLLVDAGESYWNSSADAEKMGPYIEGVLGCKAVDYVLITHFHLDHIGYVGYGGLWNLVEVQGFTFGQMLHRDYNSYLGTTSGTFDNWKVYLEGEGATKLNPVVAVEGSGQVDLGSGVTFDIIAVDGNGDLKPGDFSLDTTPPSENDYSIGAVLSYGDFDEWIAGDVSGHYYESSYGYAYHDIELSMAPEVGDVDVFRVNHHGSDHSNNATFINQLDPEVSIISVGDANTYGHPRQSVVDLVLATSDLYLTEHGDPNTDIGTGVVGGDIVISTSDGVNYTVNGVAYVATEPVRTDADGDGYFVEVDPDDGNVNTTPAYNGGCNTLYQYCDAGGGEACAIVAGEVVVNEILPAPSGGTEWVELYNTTAGSLDLGGCFLDDIADGGGSPYEIPAGTTIAAGGFWTVDFSSYYNNSGDDVRLLKADGATILDSYSYPSTGYDVSWYRSPDGGAWATSTDATPTKGASNN